MPDGLDGIELRSARPSDIAHFDRLWAEAEREDPPPPGWTSPIFAHELAAGTVVVAEREGRIVGMATAQIRGDVAFLAELAVAADFQGRGLGRQLLSAVMPVDARERFTINSGDHRAVGLYTRVGMTPRWPVYELQAERFDAAALDGRVVAVETTADDPALVEWDARVGGRRRPQDLAYVVNMLAAQPLWFRRGGATVGYGFVQQRTPDRPKCPDQFAVGPLGVAGAADAGACVAAALAWAQPRAPSSVRLDVPSPHPAFAPLLTAGFRIVDMSMFCSSSPAPAADPTIYIPALDELY